MLTVLDWLLIGPTLAATARTVSVLLRMQKLQQPFRLVIDSFGNRGTLRLFGDAIPIGSLRDVGKTLCLVTGVSSRSIEGPNQHRTVCTLNRKFQIHRMKLR